MRVVDLRDGKAHFLIWTEELGAELESVASKYKCDHPEQELREFVTSNGGTQIKKQCVRCGARTTNAIAKATISGPLHMGDVDLAETWEASRKSEHDNVVQKYLERHLARQSQQRKEYDAYLSSPQWRSKREKVLGRAGGVCEGCLERRATQVHHLDYKNFMSEFMFQLVAVCEDCHARIHELEATQPELPDEPLNWEEADTEVQF